MNFCIQKKYRIIQIDWAQFKEFLEYYIQQNCSHRFIERICLIAKFRGSSYDSLITINCKIWETVFLFTLINL